MMTTMTYDPDLKELVRLGKRLKKINDEHKALMEEIAAEVKQAKDAGFSDERIAGKLEVSRLTVARLKGGATPRAK